MILNKDITKVKTHKISLFSGANMFQFRTNMHVLFESRISRYRVWKVWKIIFIDLTSHYLTVLSFQVILRIPGWDNGGCWGRAVFWVLLTKMGQSAVIFGSCFLFCLKYENMRFIFGSCCFVMQLILIVFIASILKRYKKHNLLITTHSYDWVFWILQGQTILLVMQLAPCTKAIQSRCLPWEGPHYLQQPSFVVNTSQVFLSEW